MTIPPETMLKPNPYPQSRPAPPKMAALEYAASALNLPFSRVPINVTFDALPGGLNHVGVASATSLFVSASIPSGSA